MHCPSRNGSPSCLYQALNTEKSPMNTSHLTNSGKPPYPTSGIKFDHTESFFGSTCQFARQTTIFVYSPDSLSLFVACGLKTQCLPLMANWEPYRNGPHTFSHLTESYLSCSIWSITYDYIVTCYPAHCAHNYAQYAYWRRWNLSLELFGRSSHGIDQVRDRLVNSFTRRILDGMKGVLIWLR